MAKKENRHRVFVYGTLMTGGRNEVLLKNSSLLSKKSVTQENRFLMIQFNSLFTAGKQTPAVVSNGEGYIQGEVYEVDDHGLEKLDKLEGNGVHYQREEVSLQDGRKAWMYVLLSNEIPSQEQDRICFDQETRFYSWRREEPSI